MGSLTIDFKGEYAFSDQTERLEADLRNRSVPSWWILGQQIENNHRRGRFRTSLTKETVVAGSNVGLKVEGVTPYALLAIIGGRLNEGPLETLGRIVVPYEASLDADVRIPDDAEEGTTYIFFAQQRERGSGPPMYPEGARIFPSETATVKVQPRIVNP